LLILTAWLRYKERKKAKAKALSETPKEDCGEVTATKGEAAIELQVQQPAMVHPH